ncbi:DASH family cryptochrome [Psychrobacter frigidicola]|uniref:Cryptochrome DASH n=1 Tax=Psychrobacter frigidicola TaxID=45611 RepID=A0A5C7A6F1_9GAMM|nr:DASH family cryptochrome [Psychrobacter frigidicola]TXD98054.1 DASH family cryptochrome [Psychrobacter frigidicola]
MLSQPADNYSDKSADKKVSLVLFHNDLRIDDNATLLKAATLASANNGRLLCVYAQDLADTLADKKKGQDYSFKQMGAARQQFLYESLADLDKSLQGLGNRLLFLTAKAETLLEDSAAESDTFAQLCQLIEQQAVTDICVSQTADYNQNQAYTILQNKYPQISWHVQSINTLFMTLPTEELPKSFTQFRKKVETNHDLLKAESDFEICPTSKVLPPMPDAMINSMANSDKYFSANQKIAEKAQQEPDFKGSKTFKGGETNAFRHLNEYFNSDAPSTYKTTRNALDDWTHSTKFSAWLANGSLSVKVLLNRLRHYERDVMANESTYWIWFELLWREYFYWYALNHQQQLFWFKGIAQHEPTTCFDKIRLEQWQNGATSYPIVNACMHQLTQTGYMSNRGRQLVASCFIHELGLDWRYGASYFEQHLIDYDVGSNWGNWQYLAGVGADPRGCRQFNLSKQTQQYDPKGEFIKKWQGNKTD